jgi:NADH-quinone oxidoreductase subunit L
VEPSTFINLALAIMLLPLGGFAAMAFFGKFLPRKGDWLALITISVSCILSFILAFNSILGGDSLAKPAYDVFYTFMSYGDVEINFSILVDNMTVLMLCVVTLVSTLVHLFSMGYMHGDAKYQRFFTFLQLFTFSMLGACIAGNLLMIFVFWELVGLCSYFLIGHYYDKNYDDPNKITPREACVKAFLTTRIGDLGFFVGIMMILANVGSLELPLIYRSAIDPEIFAITWGTPAVMYLAGAALFFGPVGKSAQFPLHTWLPDAMEGPTPVSALIHAATMVAAGVYVVARMFPLFNGAGFLAGDVFHSPVLLLIALIGGFTALFAATMALVQFDIKGVLAYSTISQLGFMMLGIGCGSVAFGMYHLFTHAMFKACLFLSSGSVIHGMHHEQDMRKMGGLKSKMPVTFACMLIATIAIAGLPLLVPSGFVSKDGILLQAFAFGMWGEQHGVGLWALLPWLMATAAAVLTAFYMFRLIFLTFYGEHQSDHAEHAHESPLTMTIPLGTLALVAIIGGGLLGLPALGANWFPNKINDFPTTTVTEHGKPVEVLDSSRSTTLRIANLDYFVGKVFNRNGHAVTLRPLEFQARPGQVEKLAAAWAKAGVELKLDHVADAHGAGNGEAAAPGAAAAEAHDTTAFGLFTHIHHMLHMPTLILSSLLAMLAVFAAWLVFRGPFKSVDLCAKLGLNGYRKVLENRY